MSAYDEKDYLGTPVIINRGYQLLALLTICEQAASSLDNVGDGPYRDRVTSSLSNVMELARDIADDLHNVVIDAGPRQSKGGAK